MSIVALVGFKGSGKDTVGNMLVGLGHHRFSFADALKDVLAAMFGWDRALLEGDTAESRDWREQVDPWWADKLGIPQFTPRWAMQNVGTDILRRHLHPDLWVFNVERKIAALPPGSDIVLIDARFPNEIAVARRASGQVIRVKRGPEPEWVKTAIAANRGGVKARRWMKEHVGVHESEWAWLGEPVDAVIENDGSLEDLRAQVLRQCR